MNSFVVLADNDACTVFRVGARRWALYNSYIVLTDEDTFDGNATICQINSDGEQGEQDGFFVSHNNVIDRISLGDLLDLWNETYGTDF